MAERGGSPEECERWIAESLGAIDTLGTHLIAERTEIMHPGVLPSGGRIEIPPCHSTQAVRVLESDSCESCASVLRGRWTLAHWSIGEVTITRVVELQVPIPWDSPYQAIRQANPPEMRRAPWLYPDFVTEDEALVSAVQGFLVQTPEVTILVDTCIGNDKPRRMTGGQPLQTRFMQRLDEALTRPLDYVVCTHLHVDHVGWNTRMEDGRWVPTFPQARYLIGRKEYEGWRTQRDPEATPMLADSVTPIFDAGLVDLVETDHAICDGVRLRETPGHSPGHVSVVVESQGARALITGDFIHHPTQLAYPHWCTDFDLDRALATETRQAMLEELADTDTLILGTHFPAPTAGRVRRIGEAYRLEAVTPAP